MTPIEQLHQRLEGLGLTAIDARLEALLEQAAKAEPAYADFLLDVVTAEADARRQRSQDAAAALVGVSRTRGREAA